jgi:DNA-directed RNA polymerase subunit RPC12/RpoP
MKALIDQYSNIEFEQIVDQSSSIKEVAQRLGYSSFSGDLSKRIKKRIIELEISINHFQSTINPTIRTVENIFIENSTADQSTLRRWYFNGNYTPYYCSICGQLPEWQGKELTLILDHINGTNNDDRLENLRWVCPNCNQQLDTTNGKNRKQYEKKYYCADCGVEISKNATRCQSCAAKLQPRVVENRPSREELKELIRTMPFTKIGEKYGVSDNSIRKWCIGYNLPKTVKEIKQYSNEQWLSV